MTRDTDPSAGDVGAGHVPADMHAEQPTDDAECDYCGESWLAYELRSDRGYVTRCIPCLAIEQGQQQLSLPFGVFLDTECREDSYLTARAWFRVLARIREDDPVLKRDPSSSVEAVAENTREFLRDVMGEDAFETPSELRAQDGGSP